MRESGRTDPVAAGTERLIAAARLAVARFRSLRFADGKRAGESAFTTLHVNALGLPGSEAVVRINRVDCVRPVAFAGNPDLLPRGVLRKGDGKALLRSEPHDGAEAGRAVEVEHVEGRDIGREGVARQFAAIEQVVEEFLGT